jgi:hypothetical protein
MTFENERREKKIASRKENQQETDALVLVMPAFLDRERARERERATMPSAISTHQRYSVAPLVLASL